MLMLFVISILAAVGLTVAAVMMQPAKRTIRF
mgnify:CR=1 FL=1